MEEECSGTQGRGRSREEEEDNGSAELGHIGKENGITMGMHTKEMELQKA